jgi:HNH endonuclease/NUMOD4 motif
MTERWLPIVGHEHYEVSSLGRVRSLDRQITALNRWGVTISYAKLGRILALGRTPGGYVKASLGKGCTVLVHRLVCEAFNGAPPTPDHHVAHGDGDKTNNAPENLRWATRSENMADRKLHGTYTCGERHSVAKLSEAEARAIKASIGPARIIASAHSVSESNVCMIRRGATWRHLSEDAA